MKINKNTGFAILGIALSTVVGLATLEGIFRLFAPSFTMQYVLKMDSELGYVFTKNSETNYYWRGSFANIKTNSMGMRQYNEVPEQKSSDEYRVLVLGDSMTFGWGVNLEDSFYYLLEQKVKDLFPSKRVSFYNGGFGGYGNQENLVFFNRVGDKIKPDLVILFMGPNDVRDNNRSNLFQIKDGQLVRNLNPIPNNMIVKNPVYQKILFNSALVQFARAPMVRIYRYFKDEQYKKAPKRVATNTRYRSPAVLHYEKNTDPLITKALISKIKEKAHFYGADFILSTTGPMEAQTRIFMERNARWLEKKGIPFVNVAAEMKKEMKEKNLRDHWYFHDDTHLNPLGNRKFVEYTWPKLRPLLSKLSLASTNPKLK